MHRNSKLWGATHKVIYWHEKPPHPLLLEFMMCWREGRAIKSQSFLSTAAGSEALQMCYIESRQEIGAKEIMLFTVLYAFVYVLQKHIYLWPRTCSCCWKPEGNTLLWRRSGLYFSPVSYTSSWKSKTASSSPSSCQHTSSSLEYNLLLPAFLSVMTVAWPHIKPEGQNWALPLWLWSLEPTQRKNSITVHTKLQIWTLHHKKSA